MSRQILVCLVAWTLCLLCSQSKADLILSVIGDFQWDRQLTPRRPTAVNFSIASSGGAPSTNELNAFNLGLRIVPTAGAKGTLAIQSISVPVDNPVFTTYAANPSLVSLLDTQVITVRTALSRTSPFHHPVAICSPPSSFRQAMMHLESLISTSIEIHQTISRRLPLTDSSFKTSTLL